MKRPPIVVLLLLRLALGGLFLYASIDKIVHPAAFADTVEKYHLLPAPLVNVFALWLPITEFVVGVFLIAGLWARTCAAILTGMMAMFLVAIIQGVARGIDTHCGCFTQGGVGAPISWLTILRDVGFLALAGATWWIENDQPTWKLFHIKKSPAT